MSTLLRKAAGVAFGLLFVGAVVAFAIWSSERGRRRRAEAVQRLNQRYEGRIAWRDGETIGVCDFSGLDTEGNARHFGMAGKPLALRWSSDGREVYVVVHESGKLDAVHRIDALDAVTGATRTVLSLRDRGLEDNDIDTDDFWVAPFGDSESEVDRVYFRLGTGEWYSVEGRRARVRPEAGKPAGALPASATADGSYRLERVSNDDDDWLEIEGGVVDIKVTDDEVDDDGAMWSRPR